MKTLAWSLLSTAAVVLSAAFTTQGAGPLRFVSGTDRPNMAAAGSSFTPSFSGDGRFVVFTSHAMNLVTNNDAAPNLNVYVRDLSNSNTVLVSVNMLGIGGGNADAGSPSICSNGQFVAFVSTASNLVSNDTNDASDIFVRDLVSGVTTLVTVGVAGNPSAGSLPPWANYRLSSNPLISSDGRWVVFESLATNLVALNDANQTADIFARDLQSNTTVLVSVNAAGTGSGNGNSDSPSMTPDGRFVAFVSTSTDLVPGVTNQTGDIYVRDLQSGATIWASQGMSLSNGISRIFYPNSARDYRCFSPVVSANGQIVAFMASSSTVSTNVLLIRHDLRTGVNTVVDRTASPAASLQVSAEGRFIAYESSTNIYVWDFQTGSNLLVNVNASGTAPANAGSQTPVMTPDGRSVVFLSAATDLTTNVANGLSQVYLRDLVTKTTRLVSVKLGGGASGRAIEATIPAITDDGRLVAFESLAGDLVADDLNQASDVFLRELGPGTTALVSQRHPALAARTMPAPSATAIKSISADGRYVAISSLDSTFTPSDTNGFPDIFVRDLANGAIFPVSVDSGTNFQAAVEPVLSANGRYLVFGRRVPCSYDGCGKEDLFRRDLQNGTTALVSLRADGTGASNGSSSAPTLSSNGNLVAFQNTTAFPGRAPSDLVPGITNSAGDVFLRDMILRTNKLVSINRLGTGGGNASSFLNPQFPVDAAAPLWAQPILPISFSPSFTPDDRWIVFASVATDLTTNDTGGLTNLFARDLLLNSTRMISVDADGMAPVGFSRGTAFSGNSRKVAFVNSRSSIVVYDFLSRTTMVVCAGCDNPSISADGRFVAYEPPIAQPAPRDIVVKDLQSGLTNLISRNRFGDGGGNGDSTTPLLSRDGRFVVFASKASNLVENDTNNVSDIFVRDRLLGITLLVSLNLQGTGPGNGTSSKPVMGADGRTVVFQSFANDLVPADYNETRDVFVLHLGGIDSDGDGMDDDWEMAYFGTLTRDGRGDFDGDGQTDLQEFLAGTDPTNQGSALRVLTLAPLGGSGTRLLWSAAPGKTYQAQFKDQLGDADWTNLPGLIMANGTTASTTDPGAGQGSQRFYRVVLAP